MNRLLSSCVAVLVLLGVACGTNSPPPGDVAGSAKQRITAAPPSSDVSALVGGNTALATDLYKQLATGTDNLAFSPYSISTALAMTYAGAKGETKTAFEKTLHVSLSSEAWHRSMNFLDRELQSRGDGAQGQGGGPFRLSVNNQLFAQKGFTLLPDYLDLLAEEYGANVRLMDFRTAPEPARKAINAWVSDRTMGLIPELLGQGTITSDTRLTLVNTLYFNAAWKQKFDKNGTHDAPFHLVDGSTKTVSMMSAEGLSGAVGTVEGVQVIELPYDGEQVSMVLLVPPAGQLATFESALTADKLAAYTASLSKQSFGVQLPRFEVRSKTSLGEVLRRLGLGVAFGGSADLSGMTGTKDLSVADVLHEAVVKTDEAGTEAAAATAVVVGTTSVPSYLTVDRPFVFLIRDVPTGAITFMGRVTNP